MTLLEFITDLQSKGLTDKEVFDQAQEFKKSQATEEIVEDTEVVEETVEEVEEGNSNDSPPTGADVDQTVVAPEETEATVLESENGSVVSEKTKADVVIPAREEIEIIENASELDYRSLFLDETMKVSILEYEPGLSGSLVSVAASQSLGRGIHSGTIRRVLIRPICVDQR